MAAARRFFFSFYKIFPAFFPPPADILVASTICHLGQPVRCLRGADGEWAPTLRLALSAPLITGLIGLDADRLAKRFGADLERIGRKLRLAAGLLERAAPAPLSNGMAANGITVSALG